MPQDAQSEIEDKGDRLIVWNGNAAKRGALTPGLYEALTEAFERAKAPRIRALILTSRGGFFCAGGDLNVLIARRELTQAERREKVDQLHDLVRLLRASPVPVIAAVEGGAAGAGLSLALACDMVVASKEAQFTAAYVKAGLVPDAGLTAALARMVPRPLAMEMCLLGRPVAASRFAALGAVSLLCEPGEALGGAMALADDLAAGPRAAQGTIRQLVAQAYETSEAAQLDAERDAMAEAAGAAEAGEGIAAFLEKRKPRFA
ncbi:oxepin-CoA hydrolase, alternative type [uncultured Lentibacter sp.]|uniref:oxepin-CoA hydrolase, alternative type n=1 Tax=uncultured Lentibacter sp. TaxID=1659309 RepID=UPI0026216374|nr:enoyl-CoA hydratase family protein [uncultured Lentibacter sp.]